MSKLIDLTGQRFGFWIVEKRVQNNNRGQSRWMCICECGERKLISSGSLRSGNSTSCGCNHKPDLCDQKFGKLQVISLATSNCKTRRYWNCKCECGETVKASTYYLRNEIITSCNNCKNILQDREDKEIIDGGELDSEINFLNEIINFC